MNRFAPLALAVLLLCAWELLSSATGNELIFSKPSDIAVYMSDNWRKLAIDTGVTLFEALAGFILAITFGVFFSFMVMLRPSTIPQTSRVFSIFQVVPLIVFAPIIVSVFGVGLTSKVAMAFLFVFVSFMVGALASYRTIPQQYFDLTQVHTLSRPRALRDIYFPIMLADLFTVARVCAGLAVLGAIIAEFTGARYGLGKNIFLSSVRLEPNLMWASVVLSAVCGVIIIAMVTLLERRVGKWYL